MVSQDKNTAPAESGKELSPAELLVQQAVAAHRQGTISLGVADEIDADGFRLVKNKAWLVGKGFTIMSTEYGVGEYGDEVIITGVTHTAIAFKMRDASSGIYKQLANMVNPQFPMDFRNGLRFSEYPNPFGVGMSRTYYLDAND